jgi:hypothetical protein
MSFQRQADLGPVLAADDSAMDQEREIGATAGLPYLPQLAHAEDGQTARPPGATHEGNWPHL